MKINGGSNNGPIRPDKTREVRPASTDGATNGQPTPTSIARQDSVEISDAGRAKAAGLTAADAGAGRLAEIRQRVLKGAYDTDAVVGEVARRILDRGDV